MRRLFSTFAPGWPGAGLLLMRVVTAFLLVIHGSARLQTGLSIHLAIPAICSIILGMLLFAGLWTPITGSLVAVFAVWNIIIRNADHSACIFMATIGIALALVGPGAWSVDARLFGWKRIDVRGPKDSF